MKIHRYAVGLLICMALQTQGAFGDVQAFVKTDSLHIRSKPAAEAESIGGLKKNDRILVEKNLGEWLQISFEGKKGYIASRMTDLSNVEPLGRTFPVKAIKVGDPLVSIDADEPLNYYEKANEYALVGKSGRLYYVHTSLLHLPETKNADLKTPEAKSSEAKKPDAKRSETQKDPKEKSSEEKVSSNPVTKAETISAEKLSAGKTPSPEEQTLFAVAELELVAAPVFEEAEASLFAVPPPEKEAKAPGTSAAEAKTAEKKDPPPGDRSAVEKANPPTAKDEIVLREDKAEKELAKKDSTPMVKTEAVEKFTEQPLTPVTRSYRMASPGISADRSDPLMQRAFSMLGAAYVYGAIGPESFDCSGLTCYVFTQEGRKIPRTSEDQSKSGSPVSEEDLQPGDLLFFDTRSSIRLNDITDRADPDTAPVLQPSKVTHVGIYIGEGKMIHASSSQRKVIIAEVSTGYFAQRLITARRY